MFSKIKSYMNDNTGILIRLDDIAENMNWDLMKKTELLFEKYKIKPVLGVIPDNKDNELLSYPKRDDFWEQVKIWKDKGWEIAMHGNTHVYDKICKNDDYFNYSGGSEFSGHSLEIQMLRIKNGLIKSILLFGKKNQFSKISNININDVIGSSLFFFGHF